MIALSRSLALLLGLSLLTGCALGPNYRPPETPLSARFLGQEGVEHREAQRKADLKTWWAAFDDPTLTRFVSLALEQNLEIVQAAARVAQSRASLRVAGAALFPSGQVSAQGANVYQSLETPLGRVLNATPDFDRTASSYEANLGVSWEVDLFGGLRRGSEAARAEYAASEAGAVATRLAVAAHTADVYVTIRGLQSRIAIAMQQAQTRRQLLALVRLQYEKGIAAELQVNQAQGALAQVEAQIPILETGLDAAMNALDVLLGVQPGTYRAELSPTLPIPVAPGLAETGTPGEMIRRRPDLIVAERRLAAANARIGVAISEYYPKFSLSALLGSATTISSGNLFSGAASQALGVLGLRWRLFDFGRVDAQIAAARGQEAELLATYRLAVLRATEDVENAISALVKREAQVGILTQGESSFARARENSDAAYRGGVVSLIEVLDADGNLLQVRDAKAQAQTEAARAAIASFRALGGGWDARCKRRHSDCNPSINRSPSFAETTEMQQNNLPDTTYTTTWSTGRGEVRYFTRRDGSRLRYYTAGTGPSLVLIHTVRTQLDYFQRVIPLLWDHHKVYALDLPGMGWSDIVPGARYEEPELRAAVVEFASGLNLHDVTLAGESLGAALALSASIDLKDRVRRVVAFNSYDYPSGLERGNLLARFIISSVRLPGLGPIVAGLEPPPIVRAVLQGGFVDKNKLPEDFLIELLRSGRRAGYSNVARAIYRSLKGFNHARRRYPAVSVPVILVYSDRDWSRSSERDQVATSLADVQRITLARTATFRHWSVLTTWRESYEAPFCPLDGRNECTHDDHLYRVGQFRRGSIAASFDRTC